MGEHIARLIGAPDRQLAMTLIAESAELAALLMRKASLAEGLRYGTLDYPEEILHNGKVNLKTTNRSPPLIPGPA